jgi:hypothetical protein
LKAADCRTFMSCMSPSRFAEQKANSFFAISLETLITNFTTPVVRVSLDATAIRNPKLLS